MTRSEQKAGGLRALGAEAVAARALRVEDRRDVRVVGRARGGAAAACQEDPARERRQDAQEERSPHCISVSAKILREDDARAGPGIYRFGMRIRFQAADAVAVLILLVFVATVGTGLGVAASHVRSGGHPKSGPLRIILRGSNDVPSIQRDRVRFHSR